MKNLLILFDGGSQMHPRKADPSLTPDCVKTPFMVRQGSPRTVMCHYKLSTYPFALSTVEGLRSSFHTVWTLRMTPRVLRWRHLRMLHKESAI